MKEQGKESMSLWPDVQRSPRGPLTLQEIFLHPVQHCRQGAKGFFIPLFREFTEFRSIFPALEFSQLS